MINSKYHLICSFFSSRPFFELVNSNVPICVISPINKEVISSTSTFISTVLSDFKKLNEIFGKEKVKNYEKIKFKRRNRKKNNEEKNLFIRFLNEL